MKYSLILTLGFVFNMASISAQQDVQLESNLVVSGQITLSQDDTQSPTRGMIRFDTTTHTFQGYDGAVWIDLGASGADISSQTDTLEIGDSYGGGIVFYTIGSNGLVVTEFDLVDPNNILNKDIPWGETGITTATSLNGGKQNTVDILAFAESDNWSSDVYAAKLCDTLVLGGYEDWHLPSLEEFELINQNVGTEAAGSNNNLINLELESYWTSTQSGNIPALNAIFYSASSQSQGYTSKGSSSFMRVRAIRTY